MTLKEIKKKINNVPVVTRHILAVLYIVVLLLIIAAFMGGVFGIKIVLSILAISLTFFSIPVGCVVLFAWANGDFD